ncbi:glycerol kinase [Candidatus Riesia sp. GBBU]|nr:glycerol kinase [Candidatus Riesia sp. GBBU]
MFHIQYKKKYILIIDQGTTNLKIVIFDQSLKIINITRFNIPLIFPKSDWVEHDPIKIWNVQNIALKKALNSSNIQIKQISSIGFTNQRETFIVWDKETGIPVYNAISWKCRRTRKLCESIKKNNPELKKYIKKNTGLIIDSYFSATKLKWILDNIYGTSLKAKNGKLLFGTIDTWLIWKMTDGKVHITDYTNASRTMLFNIRTLKWDQEILNEFKIPEIMLPKVSSSLKILDIIKSKNTKIRIPISSVIGDQQSSLYGHFCVNSGMVKNTYGTGCFLLMNIGEKIRISKNGILTTVTYGENGKINYAFEGSILTSGSAITWMKNKLNLIKSFKDLDKMIKNSITQENLYFIPALNGLGSPFWNQNIRGVFFGVTESTNKNHMIRAILESTAYRTKDVLDVMQKDFKVNIKSLSVDGRLANNDFLMQFQSDILGVQIKRYSIYERTALGAALLAGEKIGFWKDLKKIISNIKIEKVFSPKMKESERFRRYNRWKKVIFFINSLK